MNLTQTQVEEGRAVLNASMLQQAAKHSASYPRLYQAARNLAVELNIDHQHWDDSYLLHQLYIGGSQEREEWVRPNMLNLLRVYPTRVTDLHDFGPYSLDRDFLCLIGQLMHESNMPSLLNPVGRADWLRALSLAYDYIHAHCKVY
jgi:hypothetical protein